MSTNKKKIFISAGDPSGDIHAANMMRELIKLNPNVEFVGIGGPKMQELGLLPIVDFSKINVVGFWEVLKKYRFFKQLENNAKNIISGNDIDLVIMVDYPGLNIRLAKYAKSISKKVCYYIAPQLWAWGKNRAQKLSDSVDKLLVVFPFEVDFFKDFGIDTEFVGHPLLDLDTFELSSQNSRIKEQVCLIPGSREQEVKEHLKLFSEIIDNYKVNFTFAVSKSPFVNDNVYSGFKVNHPNVKLYENSREAMKDSQYGIVKAGTSTLEAALLNIPFCTIYKTSTTSYLIGKYLININFLSMPNILLDKNVVEEFIQTDATPGKLSSMLNKFENDNNYVIQMKNDFSKIRTMLGTKSACEQSASIINSEFLQ